MYKKVCYIVKSNLHYYPPCMAQIRMLAASGVRVKVIYGSSDMKALEILRNEGIELVELVDYRGKLPGVLDKVWNWLTFRVKLKKALKKEDDSETILWFGTAESSLPMLHGIGKFDYILTFLELLDTSPIKRFLLRNMANNAKAIIVCEETRAYIMKFWWKLKKLPYIMPNKPYGPLPSKNASPTTEVTKNILNFLKNKSYIIYQGIFQNVEYLIEFAEALKILDLDKYFVMMGIDKNNIFPQIKNIYDKSIYIEYIPAPIHLEVTSHAEIGVLFYDGETLNKAFCAPNKIYEYSAFGIPIIGNDIPGLRNTIGVAGAGECIEFRREKIVEAILNILNNYEAYSEAAKKFYDSTDNEATIKEIINDVGIMIDSSSNHRRNKENGFTRITQR